MASQYLAASALMGPERAVDFALYSRARCELEKVPLASIYCSRAVVVVAVNNYWRFLVQSRVLQQLGP
jgi:hypothetical protein